MKMKSEQGLVVVRKATETESDTKTAVQQHRGKQGQGEQ
jgi:hypothetical protein